MCDTANKFTLWLLVSLFLAGCGGGGSASPPPTPDAEPPVVTTPPPTIPDPAPEPTPQPTPDTITFDNTLVAPFDYAQRSANQPFVANRVQSVSFANISGNFAFPVSGQRVEGNIVISVNVDDPDGISNVFVGLEGATNAITLCSNNCGTQVNRTITGVNLLQLGLDNASAASQTLELWSDDGQGNRATITQVTIDWQPTSVNGATASRSTGNINLQWNLLANHLRYNVYLSTDATLSVQNYRSITIASQHLALTSNSLDISGLDDEGTFYALIVGVDGSGESAFSDRLPIAPISGFINDPPVAVNDDFESLEDQLLTGDLTANDSDPNNEAVIIDTTPVLDVKNGELVINSDGTFSYTPPANFSGLEQFAYRISDAAGATAQAVVTLLITPQNDQPVALNNNYSIENAGEALTVSAPGLLANDFDIDVETLQVDTNPIAAPNNGELTLQTDGSFTYTPEANFSGQDQFSYRVSDSTGAQATGITVINIGDSNNPPTAANDNYLINENTTLNTLDSNLPNIFANDSDSDGDTLALFGEITPPVHGDLTLGADGHFSYIPNSNFYGVDNFVYQISDGNGGTASASVTIVVSSLNDAPVALADNYQVNEDNPLNVSAANGVLNNDTDTDNDPLRATLNTQASNGSVVMNSDGSFSYNPTADFAGSDSFSYTLSDPFGQTDEASVSIVVNNINDSPVAVDDLAQTSINTAVTIDVLTNDSDIDNDALTITQANASNGDTSIDGSNITYTPNQGFSGSDTIIYTIDDGNNGSAVANVNVTVTNTNEAPVAADDSAITEEDSSITINVLANDTDADNDTLTVSSASSTNGSHQINSDNSLTFTPNPNFNGQANINYTISDGNGAEDSAIVTITVTPVNDAPVVTDETAVTALNSPVTINVLQNDSDIDSETLIISAANADNGNTAIDNQSVTYTPNEGFSGTDIINYTVSDGSGGNTAGKVTVTVTSNFAPIAVDDSYSITEDTTLAVTAPTLLANDSDQEGDSLSVNTTAVSGPANGTVSLNSNGTFIYNPNSNFFGTDSFIYQLIDSAGGTATATVTLTVNGVNDPPTAVNDAYSVSENSSRIMPVLENDNDVDGDTLTITDAIASSGSVSVLTDNTLQYTAPSNFIGSDIIEYIISDGNGATAFANVTVTINNVNDAPVAVDDTATTAEDSSVIVDVLSNDTDADGDTLTITAASVDHGEVSTNTTQPQTLTFIPTPDFNGLATISYSTSDGNGGTDSGSVAVTVAPTNDAPTLADTSGEVSENAVNGTAIVSVVVSDIDDNDTHTFAITAGDSLGAFAIDSASGEISVANTTLLDFETVPSYELTVTVTDSGDLTATAMVAITLIDGSENVFPIFDSTFGNSNSDGITWSNAFAYNLADTPAAAAMDNLGRVVVVSTVSDSALSFNEITVSRFLPDGTRDERFGALGANSITFGQTVTTRAVATDQDGSIFIAGENFNGTTTEIFIIKLHPDGTVDSNFGTSGAVLTNLSQSNLVVGDILAHSNGTVYVAAGVNGEIRVLQFGPSAELLSAIIINMTGDFDVASALAEQADGKVLVGGYTADAANNFTYDFAVARLLASPPLALDSSFGNSGSTTFDLGELKSDMLYDMAVSSTGDIVLVGSFLFGGQSNDVAVAVLDTNGALQPGFAGNGVLVIDADGDSGSNTGNSFATSLDLDSNNNLFIGTQFGLTPAAHDYGVIKTSANGTLDSTFGSGGLVNHDINNSQNNAIAVMLDSENRPVMATSANNTSAQNPAQDLALSRFTTTGLLDSSFFNQGFSLTNVVFSDDYMSSGVGTEVAPHAGKYVMVGQALSKNNTVDLIAARFNANGTMDTSFGVNGYFHLLAPEAGNNYHATSIAEMGDGRLIIVGYTSATTGFLLMLDADGKLDSSFGINGIATIESDGVILVLYTVEVDNNNKIIVGGYDFINNADLFLGRFNLDGSFDTSFGNGGKVLVNLTAQSNDGIGRINVLDDNSLVVVGFHNNMALVAKFLSNGALDTSGFNAPLGYQALDVDTSVSDNADQLFDASIADNGTIYASGASNSATTDDLIVVALNPDGSMQNAFDNDGSAIYNFGSGHARQSLSIDPEGKLLLTGHSHNATDGGDDVFIARLTTDGAQDPLFNSGAPVFYHNAATDSSEIIAALSDGRILFAGHNRFNNYHSNLWYLIMLKLVDPCAPVALNAAEANVNALKSKGFSSNLIEVQQQCKQ